MAIQSIDHAAIPLNDVEAMLAFYESIGFTIDHTHAPLAYAVAIQDQKFNFHAPKLWQSGKFALRGPNAQPGCGDFCFVWTGGIEAAATFLKDRGIETIEGPIERDGGRAGGTAKGMSLYFRDPDENLLELICYSG